MAGTLRLSNTGTGNGQSTITTAASGDTTYTLPSGGGTFVTTSSTQALTVPFASGTVSAPSITFLGDSNTGIYAPAADAIAFTEGGVESLRIDSSGRVGIGSSTPDVLITAKQTNAGATGATLRLVNASTTVNSATKLAFTNTTSETGDSAAITAVRTGVGQYMTFSLEGNEAVRIDESRRVGIGTTTPSTQLEVVGGINATDNTVTMRTVPAGTVGYFGTTTNHPLGFRIQDSEKARIDTSGRLLIGTSSSPSAGNGQHARAVVQGNTFGAGGGILNVQSSIASASIVSGDDIGFVQFTGNDGNVFASIRGQADAAPSAGDFPGRLVFSTTADGASSPTERMRISQNGIVKITGVSGSLNPDFQLEAPGVIGAGLYIDRTNLRFYAWCGGPQTTGVYLTNAGTSWISTSDERQKTDLQPITNGLGKIGQLRSVTGRFITDEESTRRSFLIAQDVQAVLPEAIDATNPGSLGVSYTDVIPLLVAALKEAKERIEVLEQRLTDAGIAQLS